MKIFLSYTESDISIVERVSVELRNYNYEPWFAPAEIAGGQNLSQIMEQLESADSFVVFLSKASVNSRWVIHECTTALGLYLDGRLRKIVPCLLEDVRIPACLINFATTSLSQYSFATGIESLVAALKDQPAPGMHTKFLDYADSLIHVDGEIHGFILDLWAIFSSRKEMLENRIKEISPSITYEKLYTESVREKQPAAISFDGTWGDLLKLKVLYKNALRNVLSKSNGNIRNQYSLIEPFKSKLSKRDRSYLISCLERGRPFPIVSSRISFDINDLLNARNAIKRNLDAAHIKLVDIAYVLNGLDKHASLRIVARDALDALRRWGRHADEDLDHLAALLYSKCEGLVGITRDWLIDELSPKYGEMAKYRAGQLAQQALSLGLLETSTEYNDPRTYGYEDSIRNPSYDLGDLVWKIGPIACSFEMESRMCS